MFDPSTSWRRGAALSLVLATVSSGLAQDKDNAKAPPATNAGFSGVQQKGVDFLLAKHKEGVFLQGEDKEKKPHIGVTALALAAVLTKPADLRSAAEKKYIDQAASFLLGRQNENGSFGESIPSYQTSAVALALAGLGTPAAKKAMVKAQEFLLFAQNVERGGTSPKDQNYGSFGYGPGSRGDMSNTQFAIEALRATGLPKDHEALAKAIVFLQRTQNLRSVNDFRSEMTEKDSKTKHPVEPGDDGGACYYPGNSKFEFDTVADGVRVPRSYGSMTYALLKTYALCGLGAKDERMQAAADWIGRHWTLDVNPGAHGGLPENAQYQGLFYYYQTMARALRTCGIDAVEVAGGKSKSAGSEGGDAKAAGKRKITWRKELAQHLASTQRPDGSWLNEKNGRWWEDQPVMCTMYALLALADCQTRAR